MRPLIDIFVVFVDQTIGDEEGFHAQLSCNHIVAYVVADHKDFFGKKLESVENFPIIVQIWFAIGRISVNRIVGKILGV